MVVVLKFEEARKEQNIDRKEETVGETRSKVRQETAGSGAQREWSEERNSSSEKVCSGARSVRIKAWAKDMATKAL